MAIIYLICGVFFLFNPELMHIWLAGLLYAAVPAAGSAWACVRLYRATSRFDGFSAPNPGRCSSKSSYAKISRTTRAGSTPVSLKSNPWKR